MRVLLFESRFSRLHKPGFVNNELQDVTQSRLFLNFEEYADGDKRKLLYWRYAGSESCLGRDLPSHDVSAMYLDRTIQSKLLLTFLKICVRSLYNKIPLPIMNIIYFSSAVLVLFVCVWLVFGLGPRSKSIVAV